MKREAASTLDQMAFLTTSACESDKANSATYCTGPAQKERDPLIGPHSAQSRDSKSMECVVGKTIMLGPSLFQLTKV